MATLQESLRALSAAHTQNSQATHRVEILKSWLEIAQDCIYDLESNIIGKQTLDISDAGRVLDHNQVRILLPRRPYRYGRILFELYIFRSFEKRVFKYTVLWVFKS